MQQATRQYRILMKSSRNNDMRKETNHVPFEMQGLKYNVLKQINVCSRIGIQVHSQGREAGRQQARQGKAGHDKNQNTEDGIVVGTFSLLVSG